MRESGADRIAAILLAAGFGSRLQALGPKPLLKCQGSSFLEKAVEKAGAAGFDPLIIVTNPGLLPAISELHVTALIAINDQPENGMLSSIHIGMRLLPADCSGFLLCPIDYPLVTFETFHRIFEAHRLHPDRIIKPMYESKSGHPIVIPAALFEALGRILPNQGARYLLQQHPALLHELSVADPGILININTPELFHHYCE
ncbi:MAG: nucleotidyltransferase family protein [Candidatus Zhuqueibacterota bacterium]